MQFLLPMENVIDLKLLNKLLVNDGNELTASTADSIHDSNVRTAALLRDKFNVNDPLDHKL